MHRSHTLIEVLAVLTIIGIIWLLILPPIAVYRKSLILLGVVNAIASDLRQAQESARIFHCKEKISFLNLSSSLIYQRTRILPDGSEKIFPTKNIHHKVFLNSNFVNNTVIFNNLGNPQKAGQINLTLPGFKKQRSIIVSPVGRIRISSVL